LASKAHAAEAGFFHGGTVPLGWQRGEREIDQHGRSGTRLVPHPVEFPALQSAVAWAIEGDSMATVARRWLDEFGISSADGQPIYQASVLRALRSPRLMGYRLRQVPEHERQKKINLLDYIVRDAHGDPVISQEPVCDRGTWNRLQAVLSQRSNIGTRRPWGSHDWLLSGLMFCGICQARMYGAQKINKGGDKSFYYRCNANRVRGVGTCEGMGINGPNAEAYALGWIVEHLTPERLSEAAIRLAARQERSDPREAALADARAERDLLLARQQSGEFRGPLLGSMLDMLVDAQRRIDQLEDQVAQDELSPPGMTGEDLLESWPDLTIERRRHIVRRVVKRIEVSKGRGPVEDRLEVTGTW
jgi:site-specific DNA recombinase